MSIVIEGGRVPELLVRKNRTHPAGGPDARAGSVRIALINNMPDSALEDTEVQFFELLESAAGDIPVSLKLYSLPKLPHSDAGEKHLSKFYSEIGELLESRLDGVIMTGTEPRQADLRNEPYWSALTEVLDWPNKIQLRPFYRAWRRMPAFSTVMAFPGIGLRTSSSAYSTTKRFGSTR